MLQKVLCVNEALFDAIMNFFDLGRSKIVF